MRRAKLIEKRDKELRRYYAEFDKQTKKLEKEQSLIEKCSKKEPPKQPPKNIEKISENSTIKREASDHCKYVQVGRIGNCLYTIE